eukprot:TRINITY_DN9562_c0_g1_i1.p1 TRINITY_DN9562_c0_g1~~TRINITY_DN9562_c0_g1_i1.p1  ORF type:complete len:319 (-),score=9.25 TRINITY_DN9562_c0_g1_i1:180-1001(-)
MNEGVHFVYPADNVTTGQNCVGRVLAYVWTYGSKGEYKETTGPECSQSEGFTKDCGCDRDGKMFVYLCHSTFRQPADILTQTMIHELAHHTGPDDLTYKMSEARELPQEDQLHNAANYQYFGAELVAPPPGCRDDSDQCTLWAELGYCDSTLSPAMHNLMLNSCKKTCNLCPTASPTPPDAPITTSLLSTTTCAPSSVPSNRLPRPAPTPSLSPAPTPVAVPPPSSTPSPPPSQPPTSLVNSCKDRSWACRWFGRLCSISFIRNGCQVTCEAC